MDDEFYDLVYDAWRREKDPDLVSEDSYEYMRAQGYYPDEISLEDVYPKYDNSDQESQCACAEHQGASCIHCGNV